jgi:ppGpp synthetase/RelA/SpoT-type nucleotidyltranferase
LSSEESSRSEDVRKRWLEEKEHLDRFGKLVGIRIKERLRVMGIWTDIQSRTKGIDSILKKFLAKKEKYSYDTLPDLVGVRVIVRYRDEVRRVAEAIQEAFTCAEVDDKSARLAEDGVGYLSIHTEARFREEDDAAKDFPPDRFRAEVQMRTLAQHLWAEMSHDSFYKTQDQKIEQDLRRRLNLLAGLLEVADMEFARVSSEVGELPDMAEISLLKQLESFYFQFTSERGNPDLSLAVIKLLAPLYEAPTAGIAPQVETFIEKHRNTIATVFHEQGEVKDHRGVFFTQPEILMLYERLEHDSLAVREKWVQMFPYDELERVALAFGISFD